MTEFTKEQCIEKAKKYESWGKFGNPSSNREMCRYIRENGWKEDICNICGWVKKKLFTPRKWTYENCVKEAKGCSTRTEFAKKNKSAYHVALKQGWLDSIIPESKVRKWIYEDCCNEAKKYTTLKDFYEKSNGAYSASKKNDWLKDYTWLYRAAKYNYWTYERCCNEAKKYTTLKDFRKNSRLAYRAACKKGWQKDYDWLDKSKFNIYGEIDCTYAYEFPEWNYAYVGRTIHKTDRDRFHVNVLNDPVCKFAKEHGIPVPPVKILDDNLTIREGQIREAYWIDFYLANGWHLLNKAKPGSVGNLGRTKYTYKVCLELASICKNRNEMREKYCQAYDISNQKGWLDEFFGKNTRKKPKPPTKYTNEKYINECNKIHNYKYDYSKLNYVNMRTPVCIICPEHGEFWQEAVTHLNGCGCPECGKNIRSEKNRGDNEKFKQKASKVHNNKYDYSKVEYIDYYTPVCIICPEHGEFWQKAGIHLSGHGCPDCGKIKINNSKKKEKS